MAETEPEALVAPTSPRTAQAQPASSKEQQSSFSALSLYPAFKTPDYLPKPPFIDVDGIPNFRELGGYLCSPAGIASPGRKSHILRRGLLYRCAHPTQITPQGISTFSDTLKIKTVYDLRSAPEVTRTDAAVASAAVTDPGSPPTIPSFQIKGSTRRFNPVFTDEDYSPEELARRLKWYSSGTSPDPPRADELGPYSLGFLNAYRDISRHGIPAYTTMFKHILATPHDPLVFHCTAGKDRTGVFAALVLKLVGVDDETICWEYALTEPGLGAWRELFITRMTQHGLRSTSKANANGNANGARKVETISRKEAANICGSKAGNMRAFLRLVLEEEYGGIEAYLVQKCGFTGEEVQKIRKNLTVPVDEVGEGNIITPCGIPGWTPDGGVEDKIGSSI